MIRIEALQVTPDEDGRQVDTKKELKKEFRAFCNSQSCSGANSATHKQKDVPRGTSFCLDCGSALFWTSAFDTIKRSYNRYKQP
jgi:hypothetical protein